MDGQEKCTGGTIKTMALTSSRQKETEAKAAIAWSCHRVERRDKSLAAASLLRLSIATAAAWRKLYKEMNGDGHTYVDDNGERRIQ